MNDLQSRIERYLLNEMTLEEAQSFSKQIGSDPKLKEEVDLVAIIIGATRKVGQKSDMADIEVMRQASLSEIKELTGRKGTISAKAPAKIYPTATKRTLVLSIKTAIWALSGVAAIFLAIFFININKQNNNINQLYSSYYKPLPLPEEVEPTRGGTEFSSADDQLFRDGLDLYNQEKYAETLTKFNQVSEGAQRSVSVFSAISLLETGKTKQAIRLLKSAISDYGEGWEYYQDAQWYLALAYLKNKEVKEAKKILRQIVLSKRFYADKASMLLQNL